MTPGRGERLTLALPGGVTSSLSLAARKSVRLPRKPWRWVRPLPLLQALAFPFPAPGSGRGRPRACRFGGCREHSWWVLVSPSVNWGYSDCLGLVRTSSLCSEH